MTASRSLPAPATGRLPAELVDALAEVAVLLPPDPRSRAAVIHAVIVEVAETLRWRHDFDANPDELVSFGQVVAAAEHHRDRMQEVDAALQPGHPIS